MKRKTGSFQRKLLSYFIFFTAVIFTVLWLLQTVFLQRFYNSMLIRNTQSAADKIAAACSDDDITEQIDRISRENSILIYVTDSDGAILYSADEYKNMQKTHDEHGMQKGKKNHADYRGLPDNYDVFLQTLSASEKGIAELQTDDLYVYGEYINYPDCAGKAVLYLGTTLNAVGSAAKIIRIQLIWVTGLSVVIGFILAWFLSRSFSRPIAQLTNKAHQLSENSSGMQFREGFCKELDELNETLDRTAEKLMQSREFQNEFLANVSHDLRTPLTMIKGYAEMIRDISREDEQECASDVAVIVEEADRLTALVNEILEYSELQMTDKELVTEPVDLTGLVNTVTDNFENLYIKEGFTFARNIAEHVSIQGNASRLQRAVYNLLDNAVRHAGDDAWVGVTLKKADNTVVIEVSDHGSGIAKDDLERIWERYYTNRQRRVKGVSGLGLAIVKQTVMLHHGRCEAESEHGKGSTFRMIIEL